jgi:hypothetical protein
MTKYPRNDEIQSPNVRGSSSCNSLEKTDAMLTAVVDFVLGISLGIWVFGYFVIGYFNALP